MRILNLLLFKVLRSYTSSELFSSCSYFKHWKRRKMAGKYFVTEDIRLPAYSLSGILNRELTWRGGFLRILWEIIPCAPGIWSRYIRTLSYNTFNEWAYLLLRFILIILCSFKTMIRKLSDRKLLIIYKRTFWFMRELYFRKE